MSHVALNTSPCGRGEIMGILHVARIPAQACWLCLPTWLVDSHSSWPLCLGAQGKDQEVQSRPHLLFPSPVSALKFRGFTVPTWASTCLSGFTANFLSDSCIYSPHLSLPRPGTYRSRCLALLGTMDGSHFRLILSGGRSQHEAQSAHLYVPQ